MNKIPIFLLVLLFAFLLPLFANAQATVKGIVTDEIGEPLIGVSIRYKEVPQVGATTDMDGKFSIKEVEGGKILVFSYIGMKNTEHLIKGVTNFIKIIMEPEANELDQVVITGYTQTTFKKMTGSVGIITADQLKDQPQPTIDALMQGKIAGVAVSAISGQPGSTQKIRIRGTNTLTGEGEPLWVIDGVPMQGNTADMPSSSEIKSNQFDDLFMNGVAGINPNDIESITILKDASATAIYGSRAAGGVIVVTTKKGKQGKTRINYSGNVSVTLSPQRDFSLMNAQEKLAYEQGLWDEFSASGFEAGKTDYPVIGVVGIIRSGNGRFKGWTKDQQDAYIDELGKTNTNWYDELFRNGISTTHNLSISGGGDKYTYYTSMSYTKNAGLLKNNDYDRYNITTNLIMNPNDKVKIDLGAAVSYQSSKSPALNSLDPFRYAYYANPYESPYNTDGSYRADETYYSLGEYNNNTTNKKLIPEDGFNILREMNETSSRTKNVNTTMRAGIDYTIINQLRFIGLVSYTYATNRLKEIYNNGTKAALDNRLSIDSSSQKEYASILQRNVDNESYMARGHFAYDDHFGENHSISLIVGAELRGSKSNGLFSKRYGYDSITGNSVTPLPDSPTGVGYEKLKAYLAAIDASNGETWNEQRFASFYASADYYYKNKYVLNASFRTDGSSNFGSDKQFNPNWAAGAAWNISEENFMSSLKSTLNRLTLRIATGFTGNINRSISPQMIISYYDDYRNVSNNVYHTGKVVSPPNPNLRWEKTQDVKVALDFGLFNDRLNGVVEGYYRKSKDIVTPVQVLSTTGFTRQEYNTADIENKGIEISLNGTPVKTKDFSLALSANLAYNMNKVTKYKSPNKSMGLGEIWEGYPIGAIYSGKVTGIDPETGLYTFQLRPDAEIKTATDLNKIDNYRFYLGTGEAPITGGFNATTEYKGIRLSINGTFATGAKTFEFIKPPLSYSSASLGSQNENTQVFQNDLFVQHLNVPKEAANRWTPTNTNGTYPRIWNVFGESYGFSYYNPMHPEITRGVFLEDISYVRIKSIILGYTLPKKLLNKSALSNVDLSLALNNFITFTSYPGMDPETPSGIYPVSRSVMFSVNVGF
ncbi:SusC/RagA family TonB-linked outer membrane protein [Bacteroides sp.]|uniref:SusC/RagA family TonB-linked outer membrane protein n=1 Tax=Bacteroides sp. TaxID=29523 RepID=UPI0026127323|nr:SusC/RagA family TonB-linked outer membrane protein [Bacteroides sp.]MDD3036515.1 SusC/RagA family TonB-linked outer membrane protein [Bacteroides sp.]